MDEYNYSYNGLENYCYPNTDVLINNLNIKDNNQLSKAERDITRIKLLKLFKSTILNQFDFALLCNIHKNIFDDIYSWAGQTRQGDFLSKGGSIFCRGSLIQFNAERIFGDLAKENYLCNLGKSAFISRMAYYMGEINALHPFREGNGRTGREFFRQLSLHAQYILDFNNTRKEDLLAADISAFNGVYDDLIGILGNAVTKAKEL
jgi:cell filamentation protein